MFFYVMTLLFYKLIRGELKSLLWENVFFRYYSKKMVKRRRKVLPTSFLRMRIAAESWL